MFGLRRSDSTQRLSVPVTIGPGGLAPIAMLAAAFAGFAAWTGLPVAMAALLGGIGGTASLLVHELGHARAARRVSGIRTARISLIWAGAATRFEGRYKSGREQAKVAIAGPRASFAFALSLVPLCFLPMPLPLKEAVLVLAFFNVAIGLLNLVPAYPLDGHKLVVGLLWCATGSEKKARLLFRRIGFGCMALEVPSAAFLMVHRPHLGFAVAAAALSVMAQKRFIRKPVA